MTKQKTPVDQTSTCPVVIEFKTLRAFRLLFAIFAVKGFCVCVKKETLTAKYAKNFREVRKENQIQDIAWQILRAWQIPRDSVSPW
jgi:hypothetical protein